MLTDSQPIDASTQTIDPSDDLMAGYERGPWGRQIAIDNVEIGATDPAGRNLHADLSDARQAIGTLGSFGRLADRIQHHGVHDGVLSATATCTAVRGAAGRG